MARMATYDRDVWCTACALIEQHGGKAMVRAAKPQTPAWLKRI
jgi:hypothetical protein